MTLLHKDHYNMVDIFTLKVKYLPNTVYPLCNWAPSITDVARHPSSSPIQIRCLPTLKFSLLLFSVILRVFIAKKETFYQSAKKNWRGKKTKHSYQMSQNCNKLQTVIRVFTVAQYVNLSIFPSHECFIAYPRHVFNTSSHCFTCGGQKMMEVLTNKNRPLLCSEVE